MARYKLEYNVWATIEAVLIDIETGEELDYKDITGADLVAKVSSRVNLSDALATLEELDPKQPSLTPSLMTGIETEAIEGFIDDETEASEFEREYPEVTDGA